MSSAPTICLLAVVAGMAAAGPGLALRPTLWAKTLPELQNCGLREASVQMRLRGGSALEQVHTKGLLEKARESLDLAENSSKDHAWINQTALEDFVLSLNPARVKRAAKIRIKMPLVYDSIEEVRFLYMPLQILFLFGQYLFPWRICF